MISPGWCCDFSFEGLIACPAYLLRLVDSRVAADHDFVVVALDIARVVGHVTRGEVKPYPEDVIRRCGGILELLLISSDAAGDVDREGDGVFDIRHKLLLSVEPRPGLENVRARLGLRSQDCPHIRPYTVVEALHTRLREAF